MTVKCCGCKVEIVIKNVVVAKLVWKEGRPIMCPECREKLAKTKEGK